MDIDEAQLEQMTEGDLWLLASSLGLPLDDGPKADALRVRILRAAW